jgi:uncharacterized membrane protein
VAIYVLMNVDTIGRNVFRYLVLALVLSCFIDLIWLFIKSNEAYSPDVGSERALRSFSQAMSYIGFILRVLMALVYWKDSLDFEKVMLGKKVDQAMLRTFSA